MFTSLYDWMYQITFYLVVFTAAIQLLPSGSYIKYVKFFVGLVLILLVLSPVIKLIGMGDLSQIISEQEQEVAEFEETLKRSNSVELEQEATDGTGKGGQKTENGQKQIFVEPVRVE